MIHKDTVVTISIDQDNHDLEDFPDSYVQQRNTYSGPTWIEIVEDVLKVLEASYGYSIRDQVYYAVKHPLFDHNFSNAPGRELNADVLQDLIYEHEELANYGKHQPSGL